MSPNRPYLLRAFYEWLVDNDCTPHLVVDATRPGVQVPQQYVKDGQIVLNIAPSAVGNLQMDNQLVSFNARFGGTPHQLLVPMAAVLAIYARENGAGTMFEPEEAYDADIEADAEPVSSEGKEDVKSETNTKGDEKKSFLRVVK